MPKNLLDDLPSVMIPDAGVPAFLKKAAKRGAKAMAKGGGKAAAATATPAKTAAAEGFLKMLLGGKGLAAAAKANPGGAIGTGLTAFFILQMIMNQMRGSGRQFLDQNLQSQQLEGEMGQSPDDLYYQSMLPQLSQQRQGVQNAMLQAILSGGAEPPVPGERII